MKNFTKKLCFAALLFTSAHAICQVPKLSSYLPVPATPPPTIFLDFDGQTVQSAFWQNGNTFYCAPSGLNNTQITDVFNRVSEDFRPFAVNITTDSTVYLAAPVDKRTRVIVTTTSSWQPAGTAGISFIGTFTWGDETPCFTFPDRMGFDPKWVAEACSHESGHTLGLSHQSKYNGSCQLLEPYSTGYGTGETSWAPLMGNSHTKNMTGWNQGPTPYDCSYTQDNLTIITTQNGFTYRTDDYSETMNNSTASLNAVSFNANGIISTGTDRDAFKLVVSQKSNYHIEANPYSVAANNDGADLDVMFTLYNNSGTVIDTYNPLGSMKVSLDTTLNPGTYYIMVSGAGNNNVTNYGSLGSYTLTGFKGALPIHNVELKGSVEKASHRLSWTIIADEPIATNVLEMSTNGLDFTPIMTGNGDVHNYLYTPEKKGPVYYRLRTTSVINQSMYSNIVKLNSANEKSFFVSTLVQQNIKVNASDNYTYNLLDANGRMMASGKQTRGTNSIDVQNLPSGMYILQMISDNYKQTERIIKQ